jgi:hypothetical protein
VFYQYGFKLAIILADHKSNVKYHIASEQQHKYFLKYNESLMSVALVLVMVAAHTHAYAISCNSLHAQRFEHRCNSRSKKSTFTPSRPVKRPLACRYYYYFSYMAPAEFGLENTNSWWQRFSKININYDINGIQSHTGM